MLDQIDKPRTGGYAWCVYCRRGIEPGSRDHRSGNFGHYSEAVVFPLLGGEYLSCDFVAIFPCLDLTVMQVEDGRVGVSLFLCVPRPDRQSETLNLSLLKQLEQSDVYDADLSLSPEDAARLHAQLRKIRDRRIDWSVTPTCTYRGLEWGWLEVSEVGRHAARISWVRGDPATDPRRLWEDDPRHGWGQNGDATLSATLDERDLDRLLKELGHLVDLVREPVTAAA